VGVELDLKKGTLQFWLNRRFSKGKNKDLPRHEPGPWYPTVIFKDAEFFVVLNPFGQGSSYQPEYPNKNHLPIVSLL